MGVISNKILKKIDEIVENENERKIIKQLFEKTGNYNKKTSPLTIKKEFQLLVDQYFKFEDDDDE